VGLGNTRLVHVSLGITGFFNMGVALGGHIISSPVGYFTSLSIVGVGSSVTYVEVTVDYCSLVVTPILVLSFNSFSPHLIFL